MALILKVKWSGNRFLPKCGGNLSNRFKNFTYRVYGLEFSELKNKYQSTPFMLFGKKLGYFLKN